MYPVLIILTGLGATLAIDMLALILNIFKIKSLNYKYVGRWICSFPKGKFLHNNIIQSTPVQGEKTTGWIAHYLIGVSFAFLHIAIFGTDWLHYPRLLPSLFTGIVTSAAPLFIMQPAFGFGIASSKLPGAKFRVIKSLATHTTYGAGLYLAASALKIFLQ